MVTRRNNAADDTNAAGMFVSAAMTDIGRSLGNNAPEHAAEVGDKLRSGCGFNRITQYHGLIISTIALYAGAIYGISLIDDQLGLVLGVLLLIVGTAVSLGIGLALLFQFSQYCSLKMRSRLWSVDNPSPNVGRSVSGHPLVDVLMVAPFQAVLLLMVTPFWILGSAFEVLRVVGLNLIGKKHVSYRGDQGKYYEKVRKEYARRYHSEGVLAANEYLRLAYSGLLTAPGEEIPPHQWSGGKHKDWLAPMIQRHGPIEKYCTGQPGNAAPSNPGNTSDVVSGVKITLPSGEVLDRRSYAPVPDKYSAL